MAKPELMVTVVQKGAGVKVKFGSAEIKFAPTNVGGYQMKKDKAKLEVPTS